MKKLITVFMALAMIFAMSIPAFAAETNVTINAEGDRTYAAYKLLNVTTSLIKGDHPEDCGGENNHVKGCYNYAYTINPDFYDILSTVTTKTNETDIIDAIKNAGDIQDLSNRIYRAIPENFAAAKYTTFDGPTTALAEGYWLIADVTAGLTNNANSLVMIDTVGKDALVIDSKTSKPTITKKVLDKDDSEGTEEWIDSADYDINDDVYFMLTATLPNNIASYTTYSLTFEDDLSAAFTNAKDIVVKMYGANNAVTDVTEKFVKTTNDNDFTLTCANIKEITGIETATKIEVTYNAEFNGTVVVGKAGNENKVTLKYSNNPYKVNSYGEISDKVMVFTYTLVINKVDKDNNPLENAGFTLYKKVAGVTENDGFVVVSEINEEGLTTFTWTGLDAGTYKLVESTVPAGYNKMADKTFVISATHDEDSEDPKLTALDDGVLDARVVSVDTGIIETEIVNSTGTILPSTGGVGTMWLIFGGSMLVILASVFMITRKKMSVYED